MAPQGKPVMTQLRSHSPSVQAAGNSSSQRTAGRSCMRTLSQLARPGYSARYIGSSSVMAPASKAGMPAISCRLM